MVSMHNSWIAIIVYLNLLSVVKTTLTSFQFVLNQNYPNPFNSSTKICYSVLVTGLVTLKVYNILGQEVQTIFSGIKNAGNYEATFDGTKLASGVYFYRLQTGNQMLVKKMLMLK
jgi:Secretion system C-terminal sorting domain